ncbi:peptidoglycan/xylan/chitin deacetylase (PgdA/CDA1 family) [Winogradskyella wandonensis]|uniref:Peptidoglycan/xylan/chitin deacetylase (PgdA/CDA1 family) n=1 Tax=Winogradskyella wandonensis TaxID=1442586 RepID=A0A4R1KTQ0_9FLAO|nr:polysaccharide deacetylase family protein [Winogradskyella wandonensis]TCK67599.1 peptidoglycan/xylan/chitin deacetylase (PgdA/CDA1 family) [Winogradskyella wandonensis]
MQLIPAKTPGFVKSLFPNFIWTIDSSKQDLYLTFDDGPTPEITPWVLDTLKQHNAKATFFCIGANIEKHPDIFESITAESHAIGNHTYNHLKGWKHKTKDYILDALKCEAVMSKQSSSTALSVIEEGKSKLFRPPYGKFKTKQAKQLQKLGYKIVMWDVLSFDWDVKVSEQECLNNIINSAKNGSIIVMHDSVKASRNLKAVLPKVLEYYSERGFEFKALDYTYS